MSGDCGHGWMFHLAGVSGPCYECEMAALREQLRASEDECLEHARLNGAGSEREAKLMTEAHALREQLAKRDDHFMNVPLREHMLVLCDENDKLREQLAETKAQLIVPGVMYCAKCDFELIRTTLYLGNGAVGPGNNDTEPCPNGCGPMWPRTWEQRARDSMATAERFFDEKKLAEEKYAAMLTCLAQESKIADALREQLANATGNYLTLLTEPCIVCEQWKHEREALRERLARVREIAEEISEQRNAAVRYTLIDELLRVVGHD